MNWNQILREPAHGDHIVQTYQDPAFLAEAVAEYLGTGLARGEAAIIIARPAHSEAFRQKLAGSGDPSQLVVLDAAQTLARFMVDGMPQWNAFREVIGGLIAQLRLQYPAVRAYGEMVDILWQEGQRDAAIRLEEYWNELTRLQTFSLFCAYAMDALDPKAYAGLESVCKAHTHFIPARDEGKLNQAVNEASRQVLDEPLANILLSLAANHQTATKMPSGQATLLWLSQNMPRTADKVLREVKASTAER
jgi:MEDS: MEthanogen/methylotroph, DcmR Sensory domain